MLVVDPNRVINHFLHGAKISNMRDSTYYLEIDSIMPTGEEAEYDPADPPTTHVIKPGEMARVVSKEKFQITDTRITALVTLRSSMTKQGLLPLDVGIVDAGYDGPIGSIVINFSKNNITLQTGTEFFRVLFFEHQPAQQSSQRQTFTHEQYRRDRFAEAVRDLPQMFVQSDVVVERLQGEIIEELTKRMFKKYAWTIGAFILCAGLILGLLVYWAVVEFAPEFSQDEIKALIIEGIKAQIPKVSGE